MSFCMWSWVVILAIFPRLDRWSWRLKSDWRNRQLNLNPYSHAIDCRTLVSSPQEVSSDMNRIRVTVIFLSVVCFQLWILTTLIIHLHRVSALETIRKRVAPAKVLTTSRKLVRMQKSIEQWKISWWSIRNVEAPFLRWLAWFTIRYGVTHTDKPL